MAYPKKLEKIDTDYLVKDLPPGYLDQFQGKNFDEIVATMTHTGNQAALIALALIHQAKTTGDPTILKAITAALERQGFGNEKELPISDGKFLEICKIFAARH